MGAAMLNMGDWVMGEVLVKLTVDPVEKQTPDLVNEERML
jgi:hypothetical protein